MDNPAQMSVEELVAELVEVIARIREQAEPQWFWQSRLWRLNFEAMYRERMEANGAKIAD